jgi:hypothetical protein
VKCVTVADLLGGPRGPQRASPTSIRERGQETWGFLWYKAGRGCGSTQRPAPLTTIEVEARPWLTTTIELPRLGCARIAALLRSRTRTARWCGAVPTGAQNSRRAPIWLPAPGFIRTSCAVPMRAASRPTRCPIAGKRGATGSPDRVEAARRLGHQGTPSVSYSDDGAISSPPTPYHLSAGAKWTFLAARRSPRNSPSAI